MKIKKNLTFIQISGILLTQISKGELMKNEKELFLKYNFAKDMLETEINILMEEFVFKNGYNPFEHIKSRIKTKESIMNKLEKKGYEKTVANFDKIPDIIGIRIVVSFLNDIYAVVDTIKQSKNLIIKRQKDYVDNPKESGYISYHLIVAVPIYLAGKTEYIDAEIQIRTIAMDFWATLDHKIQYKFPNEIPNDIKEQLYESSLIIRELDKRMMHLNEAVNEHMKD